MNPLIVKQSKQVIIPYIGNPLSAGFPSPALDYIQEPVDLNKWLIEHPDATYFVKVQGNSMKDAFIPDKAALLVDRSIEAKHNDIVVASVNGEFTVKRLLLIDGKMILEPANKKYKTLEISEEMDCRIFGVVCKIIIDPKDV
ncbi:MAG: LexA family protein [Chitinophagales bacterium]